MEVWDGEPAKRRYAFPPIDSGSPPIRAISFSPDDSRLAVSTVSLDVSVWDVRASRSNAKQPQKLTNFHHDGQATALGFFHGGDRLATGRVDSGTMNVWDTSFATETDLDRLTELEVLDTTLSPDGQVLATITKDRIVRLFDSKTGKLLEALPRHSNVPASPILEFPYAELLCFSPDGRLLISGNGDHTATVYDANSREPLWLLDEYPNTIPETLRDIAVSHDSKTIATVRGWSVQFWDAATGKPSRSRIMPGTDKLVAVQFSPDGKRLAFSGYGHKLTLWDITSDREIRNRLNRRRTYRDDSFFAGWQNNRVRTARPDRVVRRRNAQIDPPF